MKKMMTLVAAAALIGFVLTGQAFAQRGIMWRGGGGWGPGSSYARMYNPQTVETISGEVVAVDRITPMKGMCYGVHALVKTDKETISVHLGPGWYIENEMEIRPKDKIEVKGSRIMFGGKPAIIAAEIKKGGEDLVLRNATPPGNWCTK
jgi:hypothetical protein